VEILILVRPVLAARPPGSRATIECKNWTIPARRHGRDDCRPQQWSRVSVIPLFGLIVDQSGRFRITVILTIRVAELGFGRLGLISAITDEWTTMDPKRLRKNSFVNRELQGRFLSRLAGYWIFYHLVLWHSLFVVDLMRNILGAAVMDGPRQSIGELYVAFADSHRVMLFLMVASLPIVLRDMVRLTHQVAGPLVRFRNGLRQLAEGREVENIKLRKGDLLTEFQDSFNEFLASERRQNGWPAAAPVPVQCEMSEQETQCLADVAALQAELSHADRNATAAAGV
jgi:hypothetical protein